MYNKEIFKRCFYYRGKYWYKNILAIPRYIGDLHFLIKNGYDISAHWNTDYWFIEVMKPILIGLRDEKHSYPASFNNLEEWHEVLSEMISLLDKMHEGNYDYETLGLKEVGDLMCTAKNRFFELFSEHFYNLWD